jgi:methionyl-tRNA synthetase
MELEEREGIEPIGERCEECGAKLTPQEIQAALETGGPALCTVHAAELEALPAPDDEPV